LGCVVAIAHAGRFVGCLCACTAVASERGTTIRGVGELIDFVVARQRRGRVAAGRLTTPCLTTGGAPGCMEA